MARDSGPNSSAVAWSCSTPSSLEEDPSPPELQVYAADPLLRRGLPTKCLHGFIAAGTRSENGSRHPASAVWYWPGCSGRLDQRCAAQPRRRRGCGFTARQRAPRVALERHHLTGRHVCCNGKCLTLPCRIVSAQSAWNQPNLAVGSDAIEVNLSRGNLSGVRQQVWIGSSSSCSGPDDDGNDAQRYPPGGPCKSTRFRNLLAFRVYFVMNNFKDYVPSGGRSRRPIGRSMFTPRTNCL